MSLTCVSRLGSARRAVWVLSWLALAACGEAHHTVGQLPADFELGRGGNNDAPGSGGVATTSGDGDGDGTTAGGDGDNLAATTCERTPAPVRLDVSLVLDTYITLPFTGALQNALSGVRDFVDDPRSAGTGVGAILLKTACDAGAYDPPDADVDVVPGHADAIKAALPNDAALSYTTMVPAVQAAAAQARARGRANPERKQIIVLASQGIAFARAPCGFAEADLEQSARDAFNGDPAIPLYMVALGDASGIPLLPGSLLDNAAAAGGTGQARVVDLLRTQSMGETLQAIRAEAQPCQYAIPADMDAQDLGFFTNFGMSKIPRVDDAAACDNSTSGFYLDDPAAPTHIIACPQTCGRIRFAGHESVRVRGLCPP